jgi:hypothetical protein
VSSRKIMHPRSPAASVMTPKTSILDRFTSLVSDRARLNDESLVDSAPAVFPVPDPLETPEAWLDEGSSEDDPSLALFAMMLFAWLPFLVCFSFQWRTIVWSVGER